MVSDKPLPLTDAWGGFPHNRRKARTLIILGVILLILGLLLPQLRICAPIGGVLILIGILLLIFTPGYAYY